MFWDPLIQRASHTSYLRSVGFNQSPLACRHIPSSKKTKGRAAVGRVSHRPLLLISPKSFNHDTDRNHFLPLLSPLIFGYSLFSFSCIPHPPSSPSFLQNSQSFLFSPSPSDSTPPFPPALSAYCKALMSTLARSVNYSITGRRISDSFPPPSCYSENRLLCWE